MGGPNDAVSVRTSWSIRMSPIASSIFFADAPPRVIEIGPGRGALTEPLLERFERVRALELDEPLVAPLERTVRQPRPRGRPRRWPHVFRLTKSPVAEGPWQLASNLPYSVGTAILRRFMPCHESFTRLVVMLQREVAVRVVAEPGDGNHGLMALERSAWAEAWIAFDVPPRAFRPIPKVTSAVVVLDLRPPAADPDDIERALKIAGQALTLPRKKLSNALGGRIDRDAIESAGLDPNARPGTISLDGWLRLAGFQADC